MSADREALVAGGIRVGKGYPDRGLVPHAGSKPPGGFALDALLLSGAIDAHRHAAGLAYRALRARFEAACRSARRGRPGVMPEAAWFRLKARHETLVEAAGFERFLLDRVLLDGEAPLRCEVGRVAEALGRVAVEKSKRSMVIRTRSIEIELFSQSTDRHIQFTVPIGLELIEQASKRNSIPVS